MKELCSLFEPYIHKGFKVLQLDDNYHRRSRYNVICLNAPENDKKIGISLGTCSKMVSTNAYFRNEDDNEQLKPRFFPNSGIQINHYDDENNNNFHNEIKIFDCDMNYRLIIHPNTQTIQLTDANENSTYKAFNDVESIFGDKENIIHFFSKLSFAETEQVLQVLNEHLGDKLKNEDYENINIETVLKEIKNTIEKNRKKEKKNEENSISNSHINENNIKENNEDNKSATKKNDVVNNKFDENYIKNNEPINKENYEDTETMLDKRKAQIEEKINEDNNIDNEIINGNIQGNKNNSSFNNNSKSSNGKNKEENNDIHLNNENNNSNNGIAQKFEIKEKDKTPCDRCITCLKQCWPPNEIEK